MMPVAHDLRSSLRSVVRRPGIHAAVVLCLALGIGASTVVLSLVEEVVLKPFTAVERADRLVGLHRRAESEPGNLGDFSYPDFRRYAELEVFEGLGAYAKFNFGMNGEMGPRRLSGLVFTPAYFDVLGVKPVAGRFPSADGAGGEPGIVLSHEVWRRFFGGDREALGRTVRVNGHPVTIAGVAPTGFEGVDKSLEPDIWVPLETFRQVMSGPFAAVEGKFDRRQEWLAVVGRLGDGWSLEGAQKRLDALGLHLEEAYPEWNEGERAVAIPVNQSAYGLEDREAVIRYAGLLTAVAFGLLVVASLNAGNLLLARSIGRRRDLALRSALGASRARLWGLQWGEAFLLVGLGAAFGLLAARLALPFFEGLALPVEGAIELRFGQASLVGAVLASFGVWILVSLCSGFRAIQRNPVVVLREEDGLVTGEVSKGAAGQRFLLALQAAVAVTLLIGAALLGRTVVNLRSVETGISGDIVTGSVDLSSVQYDGAQVEAFRRGLVDRLHRMPQVVGVGVVSGLPLVSPRTVEVELTVRGSGVETNARHVLVDSGFFETVGLRAIRGRLIGEPKRPGTAIAVENEAVVNENLARTLWNNSEEAVGRRISLYGGIELEVVGVVPDRIYGNLREQPPPVVYLHRRQAAGTFLGSVLSPLITVMVETGSGSSDFGGEIRSIVSNLDGRVPVPGTRTVEDLVADQMRVEMQAAWLLTLFGLVSLILALVGIYGVVSYAMVRRAREIGIRHALGADRYEAVLPVIRKIGGPLVLGVLVGIGLAGVGSRLVEHMVFGIGRTDAVTYALISVTVLAVGALVMLAGTRKATGKDPIRALRE